MEGLRRRKGGSSRNRRRKDSDGDTGAAEERLRNLSLGRGSADDVDDGEDSSTPPPAYVSDSGSERSDSTESGDYVSSDDGSELSASDASADGSDGAGEEVTDVANQVREVVCVRCCCTARHLCSFGHRCVCVRQSMEPFQLRGDDVGTTDIVMGGIGFVFALAIAMFLPSFGVDHSLLMAGGLLLMVAVVLLANFMPKKSTPAQQRKETSNTSTVFLVAAGLGCMLGAMFGNVVKNVYLVNRVKVWEADTVF